MRLLWGSLRNEYIKDPHEDLRNCTTSSLGISKPKELGSSFVMALYSWFLFLPSFSLQS
jgi:hypothetical protein